MIDYKDISNFKHDGSWCIPNSRSYFDAFSHQFNKLSWNEKLENLAFLVFNGMDLIEIIRTYIESHSETTLKSLKDTLLSYIQILRWGEPTNWTSGILEESEILELTQTLQEELKLRYLNEMNELNFSFWGEDVEAELIKRAEKSREKIKQLLLSTDFSEEFLNK